MADKLPRGVIRTKVSALIDSFRTITFMYNQHNKYVASNLKRMSSPVNGMADDPILKDFQMEISFLTRQSDLLAKGLKDLEDKLVSKYESKLL